MNNADHRKAKILTLIPLAVFAVIAIILVPLTVDYLSTGSDVTAVALIFLGSSSMLLTTAPCLVMSVMGTVFASKAIKEGALQSRKFFVMGIIEILVFCVGVICAVGTVILSVM